MLEIDGSKGGGQILRTALALSAIKQEPFQIANIREKRPSPGLKKQHQKCIEAINKLTRAEVEGNKLKSSKLVFQPRTLASDDFTLNIETAGSINQVYNTIIPLALKINGFKVRIKGGTDVKWSPTAPIQEHVKINLLNKQGFDLDYNCVKTGFYPKGQGEIEMRFGNSEPSNFEPDSREELKKIRIDSKASKDLKSQNVAERQAKELEKLFKNEKPGADVEKQIRYEKTASTGSVLSAAITYENSLAGFDGLGERGVRAEQVAKNLYEGFRHFDQSCAAVDKHLGDQLMIYAGLLGWKYTVPKITSHMETNKEVVNEFLDGNLVLEEKQDFVVIKGKEKVV